jgi:type II pantothenate kinase
VIYLKSFPSAKISDFISFVKRHRLVDKETKVIHATGGGAYKYNDLFDSEFGPLGVTLQKHDEMQSMVNGMAFVLNYGKEAAFSVSEGG